MNANAKRDPMRAVAPAIVLLGAAARLLPHPPNLTPIGAMALFGGARLRPRIAIAASLGAMALSDVGLWLIMGHDLLTPMKPVVYGCFIAIAAGGTWLRRRGLDRRPGWIAAAAVAGGLLFFFATNFAVWALSDLYPKTGGGLAACFVAAIPFYRNTLLGDLFWSAALFGGEALAARRIGGRAEARA
jgi:hypothetical protein